MIPDEEHLGLAGDAGDTYMHENTRESGGRISDDAVTDSLKGSRRHAAQ